MDTNELKNKIMEILNKIETGQSHILIVNANETKTIPTLLLMIEVACPTLDDMKKAVSGLELENKIIVFSADTLLLKLMKILNSSDPSKAVLDQDITDDEVFIYSYVRKANEKLLKVYKKLRDKDNKGKG